MPKSILSVVGQDRPGIVAAVSGILADLQYNIEDISQTILQDQFAALFIVTLPEGESAVVLQAVLENSEQLQGLTCSVRAFDETIPSVAAVGVPFVIITIGPDAPGLIAAIAGVLKRHAVNILNLQAVNRSQAYPEQMVMIYEVSVPEQTALPELRAALDHDAAQKGLEVSVQHKDIFEEIHRL